MKKSSRRDFLKFTGLGLGGIAALSPSFDRYSQFLSQEKLGRTTSPVNLRQKPDLSSEVVTSLPQDEVVPWYREVVGSHPYRINQRWVETEGGYIWCGNLQPVQNIPNTPVNRLPVIGDIEGMWVEVTIPWVDITLDNPPARSFYLKNADHPRLYYSQILWADAVRQDDQTGTTLYRLNQKYGYGDIMLADATAFRPILPDELDPIRPEVEDKRVIINLKTQTMSCLEGSREVYYCRISTGAKFDIEGNPVKEWATPPGPHPIWRKLISLHMSGGTTGGGYDLPGIGWTTLFVGNGVAIHSTFWHNNFGVPMSHGCVNAKPEDAKWVFRWTTPHVSYYPGDIIVEMPGGTIVDVVEG